MNYPVVLAEAPVGTCELTQQGLYWQLHCSCQLRSGKVERLYCGTRAVGVLEPLQGRLELTRRLSRSAWPELPPESGVFSLAPAEQAVPWEGEAAGCHLAGMRKGNRLLFPYDPAKPCPCEPLCCFFEIRDGFWQLPLETLEQLS